MSELTPEEIWVSYYPDDKMPGTAEPLEGKCGAKMRDKRLKELDIIRYCGKTAGMGTDHLGEGTCKFHLGSTAKHTKGAIRTQMTNEIRSLAEKLGEPDLIGPPEIEAWILASKMKQWSLILEDKMDELNGSLEVTDKAGVEHTRALIEIMERAWERFQAALEFMMKYDLRKRVIELEEHQAQLVGAVFMAIILSQDLKLSESQIASARMMFAEKMQEIGPAIEPTWATNIVDIDSVRDQIS
jgi:hypothetical protein